MQGLVMLSVFGADHAPATLIGSCGPDPGIACRLVWNVTHDQQAATLTSEFFAGPVHLLLQVLFVVLLALVIQWAVHRLINRVTDRASSQAERSVMLMNDHQIEMNDRAAAAMVPQAASFAWASAVSSGQGQP